MLTLMHITHMIMIK